MNYYNNLLASDWGFALTFLLPTLISGINWLVTLWKLSCFYKDYGVCAASIAQTCLTFAFIGNSQRIIQFIWEHDITCCSYQFRQVMYSSSFSLTLSSCVLLAFYWMDSIHHKVGSFNSKEKKKKKRKKMVWSKKLLIFFYFFI